ncbi:hypothetical protein GCM10009765_82990 [Fodinicola feengrottensis]|uniref:IPT/TIG domain-containing protein n=2 Tax=Fodinicola feengrottensis TaxID=435914 RepID=A0ABN2JCH2_9ACTN
MAGSALVAPPAVAQADPPPDTSVNYAYDAAGRLAGVTQQQSGSAGYRYDPNGNLTTIHRQAASALSVLSVVPAAGSSGQTVTLHGAGFVLPASENTVLFGETAATVTAATPTTLTVTVPDGATSGAVTVTTSAGSATSRESFTVRANAGSLAVSDVSPTRGGAGTTVTISGAGFDPDAALDAVSFGHTRAQVTAATATALTVTVPETAGSGPVTVAAGGRSAPSPAPFLVVPSALDPADKAVDATVAVDGPSTTVSLPSKDKYALVRFDGSRGQRLSLGASGGTVAYSAWVELFDPYGAGFGRDEYDLGRWIDQLNGAYDLPPLPVSGTYQIMVTPDVDNVGPVTLTLSSKTTGSLVVDGAGSVARFDRPGQETELSLPVTKGQQVDLGFDQATFPKGNTTTVTVREPNGTPVLWDSDGATSGFPQTNGPGYYVLNPAETGTYTVVLASKDPQPGSFRVVASSLQQGGALALGTAVTATIARPGQQETFTYAGTINEELGLDVSGITATKYVPNVTVAGPDGAVLFAGQLNGHRDLPPLTATGIYRVTVHTYSSPGSATLRLATRPVSTSISPTGPTVVSTIASKGGTAQLTFPATKGVPLTFAYHHWGFGSSVTLHAEVLDPNGDEEDEYDGLADVSTFAFTPDRTGQYRVQLTADGGKSTGSVSVTLSGEVAAGALDLGVETPLSASRPGQPSRFTFAGTKGQKLSFVLGTNTFNYYLPITIKRPDGQTLWNDSAWSAVDLDALPQTGTYQVVVAPFGETGSGQVRIAPTVVFPAATIGGAKASLAVGLLGGVVQTTFTAKANEGVSLGVSGSDFTTPVAFRVLGPDGSIQSDSSMGTGSFADFNAPKDGTYRLMMEPLDGDYGSLWITLSDQVNEGSISLTSAKTLTLGRTGQTHYVSFKGNDGQKLELSFAKMTTRSRPWVGVSTPAGDTLISASGDANPVVLPTLPADGTYWIYLNPYNGPGSVTITLAASASASAATRTSDPARNGVHSPAPLPGKAKPILRTRPKGGHVTRGLAAKPVALASKKAPTVRSQPGVHKDIQHGLRPACATCSGGTPPPPGTGPPPGGNVAGGDPVDLATGLLIDTETDLTVPDTIPLTVARTYRQNDSGIHDFGVGDSGGYNLFLYAPHGATSSQLVLADGGRISFQRLTPGGSRPYDYADAVFTATPTPTKYAGAVMAWNGDGFDVRLLDGTTLVFGENAPLQAIRDRYGNTVTITRGPGTADQDTGFGLSNGPVTQVTAPHGRWVRFTYDALNRTTAAIDNTGRTVSYGYDSHGHLATVTDPTGGVSSYTYDSNGRMATAANHRGQVYLTNTYDSYGRVSKQVLGDGGTYQFAYTLDAAERLTETRMTDQLGTVHQYIFNKTGYLTSYTTGYGNSLAQTVTVVRDPVSNQPTSYTDALGRRTDLTYDAYGSPITRVELAGTSAARTEKQVYDGPFHQLSQSIDAMGQSTTYAYRPDGSLATVTDPLSRVTTSQTNADGQVTGVTDPLGHRTSTTYLLGDQVAITDATGRAIRRSVDAAGWVDVTTDPLGAATVVTHDAAGRVLASTNPLGQHTTIGYDADGNATKFTDPSGHSTTYTFDAENHSTAMTDPLSHASSYSYDPAGNLTSTTTASGKVTKQEYDALGRLRTTRYSDSTITYTYDAGNRVVSVADSKNGTVSNVYDGSDHKTRVTTPAGRIDYTYDTDGNRVSMTVAGQQPVSYTLDAAGELTDEAQGSNAVSIAYDGAGRRTSVTLPDSVVQSYTYDSANEITGIGYGRNGTNIGDLTYAYDQSGQVSSVGGSFARTTIPQEYGPATYDAGNELSKVGDTAYSYDKDGNLLSNGTTSYVWNSRGQLASSASGAATTTYGYDALGRRTSKGAANYLFDGANVVEELSGSTVTATRMTGGVDEVFARTAAGSTRSLLTDRLNSTVAVADGSGGVTGQYTYEPFGATTATGDDGGNATRFTGRDDDGSGQYFNRARYYTTADQRFLSADPTGLAGGDTNVYAYTGNRPTTSVDPLGLSAQQAGGFDLLGWLGSVWQNVVWNNKSWWEIGLGAAAIIGTAVAAVVTAPAWAPVAAVAGAIATGATVAGLLLGAADTAVACSNGERLSCGAGIAGVALAGEGALIDRLGEKFLESLGSAAGHEVGSTGPALSNVWNWGSIGFTGIGGFVPNPEHE